MVSVTKIWCHLLGQPQEFVCLFVSSSSFKLTQTNMFTPWKFNIASENGWLEDEFPFGIPYVQGLC